MIRRGSRGHYALGPCRNSNRSAPRPTIRRLSPPSSPPRLRRAGRSSPSSPTGGDVTAYVCRERDGGAETKKAAEVVRGGSRRKAETKPSSPRPPSRARAGQDRGGDQAGGCQRAVGLGNRPRAGVAHPGAQSQPAAAAEPTTTYQPSLTPSSAASTPAATGPSTGPTAVAPAAAPAAAAPAPTPAVPAGWYADPAGRFELRYWDGSTWTEHVSRAGQQFTDPPSPDATAGPRPRGQRRRSSANAH